MESAKLDYETPKQDQVKLARNMGLFALIVYGVGDMVGAGIYATVGKAAQQLGNAVWLGFIASMIAALLTGLSYASIASRYPRAAGAAYVTHRAFRLPFLSYLVGLTVTASGLTSMAASTNAFATNLNSFFSALPVQGIIVAFLLFIAAVNFWGIRESMWVNLLCTSIEVGGLVFIIIVGARFWGSVNYFETATNVPISSVSGTLLILNGAVLTFFSFVGFEDMLNVGEEVKNPQRNMPWGILIALAIATLLYIGVSVTAVSVVDYHNLGDEKSFGPATVQVTDRAAPWLPRWVFGAITLFAVANTALINYIMGSRLVYGMARQRLVPAALGKVHPGRRTPHVSIGVLAIVVLALALTANTSQLASATALLLLGCFTLINFSLIILKNRPNEPKGQFEIPSIIPLLGAFCCFGLVVNRLIPKSGETFDWKPPAIALGLGCGIALLYLVMHPGNITEESLAHLDDDN